MAQSSTAQVIDDPVLKYENFVNDVLKEDLKRFERSLKDVNGEITALIEQKHSLKIITDKKTNPNGFKTQVNLGCHFYVQASVVDTSKVLMHVGLHHYLELTINEANKFLEKRIKTYEKKAEDLKTKSAETKAHIKLMLFHIGEMESNQMG